MMRTMTTEAARLSRCCRKQQASEVPASSGEDAVASRTECLEPKKPHVAAIPGMLALDDQTEANHASQMKSSQHPSQDFVDELAKRDKERADNNKKAAAEKRAPAKEQQQEASKPTTPQTIKVNMASSAKRVTPTKLATVRKACISHEGHALMPLYLNMIF